MKDDCPFLSVLSHPLRQFITGSTYLIIIFTVTIERLGVIVVAIFFGSG
jgi:hypothetical protein